MADIMGWLNKSISYEQYKLIKVIMKSNYNLNSTFN